MTLQQRWTDPSDSTPYDQGFGVVILNGNNEAELLFSFNMIHPDSASLILHWGITLSMRVQQLLWM
jgi:hypothetical protein